MHCRVVVVVCSVYLSVCLSVCLCVSVLPLIWEASNDGYQWHQWGMATTCMFKKAFSLKICRSKLRRHLHTAATSMAGLRIYVDGRFSVR